jgi:GNAT superfamily N-acetyltransferase
MIVDVTTWYLEMTQPDRLRPKPLARDDVTIRRCERPLPELNRFLYTAVGGDWFWIDRLAWTRRQWLDWIDRPQLETWLASIAGTPAGYYELESQPEGNVEIAYFGLIPAFAGMGVGGALLTHATETAWAGGASRVWVHTCSLDHPAALANYKARGFRIYREETRPVELPDEPPGPWPGARSSADEP